MSLACLVLPKDLLNLIRLQRSDFGWLSVAQSKRDHVYVALKLQQGSLMVPSQYDFVHRHARLTNALDQVPWYKVKQGFGSELAQGRMPDLATLRNWVRSPADVAVLNDMHMVLFVEPDGKVCCAWIFNDRSEQFSIFQERLYIVEPNVNFGNMQDGLVPINELSSKTAVIIGVGSGGGNLAIQLAAAGVGRITLIDPDRLEPANVFRHVCGLEYVGCYKVDAVKELIERYGLRTKVTALRQDILEDSASFFETVNNADLVVCASDTKQSRTLANFAAVSLQKPLVAACTYDGATVGEIFIYLRDLPCLECVRIALREAGALETDRLDTPTPDMVSYRIETIKQPHSRGTRVDTTIVASLATKVSLLALTLNTGKKLLEHMQASYLVWGGAKNQERAAPFSFDLPMSLQYVPISRQQNCPVCGEYLRELEKKHEERLSRIFCK